MPPTADILRRWQAAMNDMNAALDKAVAEVRAAAQRLEQLAEDLRKDDGRAVSEVHGELP